MYAVIKTGGKQHKVKPGDVLEVELMEGGVGDTVTFQPLLVVDDEGKAHFGKEAGRAVVTGTLLGEKKGDKVRVFKYRPKSGYARRQGHRQLLTLVEIQDIGLTPPRQRARKAQEKPAEAEAEPTGSAPEAEAAAGQAEPAQAEPAEAPKPVRTTRSRKATAEES